LENAVKDKEEKLNVERRDKETTEIEIKRLKGHKKELETEINNLSSSDKTFKEKIGLLEKKLESGKELEKENSKLIRWLKIYRNQYFLVYNPLEPSFDNLNFAKEFLSQHSSSVFTIIFIIDQKNSLGNLKREINCDAILTATIYFHASFFNDEFIVANDFNGLDIILKNKVKSFSRVESESLKVNYGVLNYPSHNYDNKVKRKLNCKIKEKINLTKNTEITKIELTY